MTAGSLVLVFTNGAIALTAIPIAPMKTIASLVKCSSVHWDKPPLAQRLISNSQSSNESASLPAISMPLSVNAIVDIFISCLLNHFKTNNYNYQLHCEHAFKLDETPNNKHEKLMSNLFFSLSELS